MVNILLVSLVHNRKNLLRLAVQSVLRQTLSNADFKYLLFNNASSDGSELLIKAYDKKFAHIYSYNSSVNMGQQPAYNKILNDIVPKRFPEADVIAILDDDDELYPQALKKVKEMYERHPEIGATYSGFSVVHVSGRVLVSDHGKAKLMPDQFSDKGQLALRRRMCVDNPCGHLRTYSIRALRDVGGFPTDRKYATDFCVFAKIIERHPVVKIDDILYQFRQGHSQIQSKHSPQQTEDWKYYQSYFRDRWTKIGLI